MKYILPILICMIFCGSLQGRAGKTVSAGVGQMQIAAVPNVRTKLAWAQSPDTHFVIGADNRVRALKHTAGSDALAPALAPLPPAPQAGGHDIDVFFAPDTDIHELFIRLIREEKETIQVAMFMFSNKDIAQALIAAKQRGVDVEVITDPACVKDKYNKLGMLLDAGIPVYVYNPAYEKKGVNSIHHLKVAILGKCVLSGSANWTKQSRVNQEQVISCGDTRIVAKFRDQFVKLKKRAKRYISRAQLGKFFSDELCAA